MRFTSIRDITYQYKVQDIDTSFKNMQKSFACFSCSGISNIASHRDYENGQEDEQNRILREQETKIKQIMRETYEARQQLHKANSKLVMIRKTNGINNIKSRAETNLKKGGRRNGDAASVDILDVDDQDIVILPSDKSLFDNNDFDDEDEDERSTDGENSHQAENDWKNTTVDTISSSSDNSSENENRGGNRSGNTDENSGSKKSDSKKVSRFTGFTGRNRNSHRNKHKPPKPPLPTYAEAVNENENDDENQNQTLVPVSSIPIYKTADAQVQEIGKSLKKSKLTVTWSFQHGGGERTTEKTDTTDTNDSTCTPNTKLNFASTSTSALHFVTLTYSKCSGRVLIHMDGKQMLSTKIDSDEKHFIRKWTVPTALTVADDDDDDFKEDKENSRGDMKNDKDCDYNNGRLEMQIVASRKLTSIFSLRDPELIVNGRRFSDLPDIMN